MAEGGLQAGHVFGNELYRLLAVAADREKAVQVKYDSSEQAKHRHCPFPSVCERRGLGLRRRGGSDSALFS